MIYFAVLEEIRFILDNYLASEWGRPLQGRLAQLDYPSMFTRATLPGGTWIFTAQERLTPAGREIAGLAWEAVARTGGRALNHPLRVVERYELLRRLHESGANRFRAVRVTEYDGGLQFPVFLREENEHSGSLSALLRSESELRGSLAYLKARGFAPEELLVVEFCDTANAKGHYRKYSAYFLNGEVLPRHLHVCTEWVAKSSNHLLDPEFAREEVRYVEENPHAARLRQVFETARIDYGRVDYGMLGDEPQIWEINTAPTISIGAHPRPRTPDVARFRELQVPGKVRFHEAFRRAFEAIDRPAAPVPDVVLAIEPGLLSRWREETADRVRLTKRRRLLSRLGEIQAARAVRRGIEPTILKLLELWNRRR